MRKTLILLVVLALCAPAVAGARSRSGEDAQQAKDRRVKEKYFLQQTPPQPRPRPAPRVFAKGRPDLREEQRETITKTVRIGGSGVLDISTLVGDIEVVRGGGNEATIEVTKVARARTQEEARDLLPLVTVEINARGERAEIRTGYGTPDMPRKGRNMSIAVHFKIKAPQGTRVTARTMSGSLRATDIRGELALITTAGDVSIANAGRVAAAKSTAGSVEITNVDSDTALDAGTISGDVTLRKVKARRIDLATVSGRIVMEDVQTERLGAQSLSGDVEFRGSLARGGRYELKSHSGTVRLLTGGGTGFEVEANSWSGNVQSQFPVDASRGELPGGRRKALRGVIGDGGAVVTITTFSGNVELVKR